VWKSWMGLVSKGGTGALVGGRVQKNPKAATQLGTYLSKASAKGRKV
jgi:hypothetical protein